MNTALQQMDASAQVLTLPREEKKAPRAYIVGSTDTGKSTLMEVLMQQYRKMYSTKDLPVRTLIIDSKPRFRAERETNGLSTRVSRRYSKWWYGSGVIPGSYTLSGAQSTLTELEQIWSFGSTIAIAQTEHESEWSWLSDVARDFFEGYGAKHPRLLIVDELADFYKYRRLAEVFEHVARNGRERDCALIAGSQRPRKVPKEIMTEMLRLYMFELQWVKSSDSDLSHIMQFGLPEGVQIPFGHVFYMWDRKMKSTFPSNAYHELDLSTNYYTGKPRYTPANETMNSRDFWKENR